MKYQSKKKINEIIKIITVRPAHNETAGKGFFNILFNLIIYFFNNYHI
jgi:hypothetical protein